MEAWRVFTNTEARTKDGRLGRVLEVFIDSGSIKVKWLDTGEIEIIPTTSIISTRKVVWEDTPEESPGAENQKA